MNDTRKDERSRAAFMGGWEGAVHGKRYATAEVRGRLVESPKGTMPVLCNAQCKRLVI